MPPLKTLSANGLEFSYLSYGEGPLLLCFHGFPDSAYSWNFLAPRLAELGYQVVAPFMRGYEPTEIPESKSYSAIELGNDVLEIIKALAQKSAIVIGHDWGALAAYTAANLKAPMVSKLITLAIPHPGAIKPSFRGLWRARHFITFQFRNSARRMLRRDQLSGVDEIYRRWSPSWSFEPGETELVKESFKSADRLDAALGYYWSFREDAFGAKSREVRAVMSAQTSVPTLCLVGDNDGALDLSAMKVTPRFFSGEYRYEVLEGVGHFLHRESPDAVYKHIAEFLAP